MQESFWPEDTKTVVVNLKREPFDVYIGRPGQGEDGYFGNPVRVERYDAEHLADVLTRFRAYFMNRVETDPEFRDRVRALRGKRLGCFCKPGRCHGDVIVEWIESQREGTT